MEALVSVVVPVYNVEKYLRQCLDSVINQTYRCLEILVVDDGSTDGSAVLCDEYLSRDERVQVFHIANQGLSAARNYAIDRARGKFIAFVDSDDWLEEKAIQILIDKAITTNADVISCRFYQEYVNKTEESSEARELFTAQGEDILKAVVLERKVSNDVWNKLYKAELFESIRYPNGRVYEDIATTYQLLQKAEKLTHIPDCLIHYRNRKNSISNDHSMKRLIDYWAAYRERFEKIGIISSEYYRVTLSDVVYAISRMWRWYSRCSKKEKRDGKVIMLEMQAFIKEHRREILKGTYSRHVKATCHYALTKNPLVLRLLYMATNIYRRSNNCIFYEE